VIHVIASRGADLEDVRQRTVSYLREKDMDILVQVEREGDGRCWCGGGSKSP
jgi:zinc transporter 5/7